MTYSPTLPAAAIILAAGKGTRMKSALPKVMHKVAGTPMVGHVLSMAEEAGLSPLTLVISSEQESVKSYAKQANAEVRIVHQSEQLGTAHAVLAAREALSGFTGNLVVLYGDTPLIRAQTVSALLATLESDPKVAVAVLGFRAPYENAYGRLIVNAAGELDAIVEYKEATPEQRAVELCNSGVMVLRGDVAWDLLSSIGNSNAKGEYYLTDIIALARNAGYTARYTETWPEEVLGVNSRVELAVAEAVLQSELRLRAMENGATLIAPDTIYLSSDTMLGRDVIIEPHVVFGSGVTIGDDVEIRSYSHISGATIEKGAVIGPFARIRPGTTVGEDAKIGNFVEVKKSIIEQGAKISHLSYIGDATIGAEANIGAGTITCNYDGYSKSRTVVGREAFIGSNTALVAPVTVGERAIVAAGSVITEDVAADALAVARARQAQKYGWAEYFRTTHKKD